MQLSEVKKSVINVLTLVLAIGTPALNYAGILHLPDDVVVVISTVLGIAGALLHYLVPNTTTDPVVAQTQSVRLKGFDASRGTA